MKERMLSQSWVVYNYADLLNLPIPRRGEHVLVANAPPFSAFPIIITGDGTNGWAELIKRTYHMPVLPLAQNASYVPLNGQVVGVPMAVDSKSFIMPIIGDGTHDLTYLSNQAYINTATLAQMITQEITNRQAADIDIYAKIAEVKAIAEGAGKGIVFDDTAQLDAWLAGTYVRPDGELPSDLIIGEAIFIRARGEPDYFWDGSTYWEQESKIDLSGYYTSLETDALLALKAPINSPDLTGIPTTPTPDGNTPQQIVNYGLLADIAAALNKKIDDWLELMNATALTMLAPILEPGDYDPTYLATIDNQAFIGLENE